MYKTNLKKMARTLAVVLATVFTSNTFAQSSTSVCKSAYLNAIQELEQQAVPQANAIMSDKNSFPVGHILRFGAAGAVLGGGITSLIEHGTGNVLEGVVLGGMFGSVAGGIYGGELRHVEGEEEAAAVLSTYRELITVRNLLRSVNDLNNISTENAGLAEENTQFLRRFMLHNLRINPYGEFAISWGSYLSETNACGRWAGSSKAACYEEFNSNLNKVITAITNADSSGQLCQNGQLYSLDQVVDLVKAEF